MGLGTCGNRDMWGRDMCPHPNSVGTNGIGTYGVGTYGVGTCGIGTYVLEPSEIVRACWEPGFQQTTVGKCVH